GTECGLPVGAPARGGALLADRAADGARRMKLYDAARCPYCARVRMALVHKSIDYEPVEIDLGNRPGWLYELNASGKVPVLDDGFVLAESAVIMEYLEERYPEHPLLPDDPAERAGVRLHVFRF